MNGKVYILDYDLISPLGCGKENVYHSLATNYAGEKKITRFDTSGMLLSVAAEITSDLKELCKDEDELIKTTLLYDRKFELTVAIYGLMRTRLQELFRLADHERKGVVFGLGADVTPFEMILDDLVKYKDTENPFFETAINKNKDCIGLNRIFNPYDLCSIFLAGKLELGAFQKTCLTACAASNQSVGIGYRLIREQEADLVLAGGSDSILNPIAFTSFYKLGVLAPATDEGKTCKPFDINRCGTLAGEAAGLCVLASEDFIRKHRLTPLFEILSYGDTLDAYQITSPDPEGKGMTRALVETLKDSGISPSEIDYINLHGTGTRLNDQLEIQSLKNSFGPDLKKIPASSTKDRHGHAIAAAGIQELAVLCISLENDFIPCNMNLEKPLEKVGVDLVQNENRYNKLITGMNCNYSFGGVNTALIIRKIT